MPVILPARTDIGSDGASAGRAVAAFNLLEFQRPGIRKG